MKKLEDFLVTGLVEDVGGYVPRPAMLDAWTKKLGSQEEAMKFLKKNYDIKKAVEAAGGKMVAGGQLISSGPQFGTPEEAMAYETASQLMGGIQAGLPQDQINMLAQSSRAASSVVDQQRKAAKKISPVYKVTFGDFKAATGMDYDPMSREHQRLFFDLNARGAPNLPATTGVGQGPAYGSFESAVMRERPKNIPQFGTPEAYYDVVDGQLAATTPQSRAREAEEVASLQSRLKAEKEEVESTQRAREQAKRIVGGELAMDYVNKMAGRIGQPEKIKSAPKPAVIDVDAFGPAAPVYGTGSPNWSDQQRGQFPLDMYTPTPGMDVVDTIDIGTVDLKDMKPKDELSDFEGFGYPFPRETTMPGLVAAAGIAGQQHGGGLNPELYPEAGQDLTPSVAATVANLSGADATRPAAKGFKMTGLPRTVSDFISRYGKNKKFSERPATTQPEATEKESLNKIISDEPFTWARDVEQRGGTRPPLVVKGSGFEPESAGQERLKAQQYQERAARFKKVDVARKAADLEYTRATGKLPTAQKTAVNQYAYQDIFKRQLKKMGFSSEEINDIIGLD